MSQTITKGRTAHLFSDTFFIRDVNWCNIIDVIYIYTHVCINVYIYIYIYIYFCNHFLSFFKWYLSFLKFNEICINAQINPTDFI